MCGICVKDKMALKNHLQTHKKKIHKCTICNKNLASSSNLGKKLLWLFIPKFQS